MYINGKYDYNISFISYHFVCYNNETALFDIEVFGTVSQLKKLQQSRMFTITQDHVNITLTLCNSTCDKMLSATATNDVYDYKEDNDNSLSVVIPIVVVLVMALGITMTMCLLTLKYR